MNRNMRKTVCALMILVSMAWSGKMNAQAFEYPDYPDRDKIAVSYQGSRPTISDFVTAYLNYVMENKDFYEKSYDELYVGVYESWNKFKQQKPLADNVSLTADVRNGYMHYERVNAEPGDTIVWEMCFWNCADGKQKLVCANAVWKIQGDYGATDGSTFLVYDNAKKTMRFIYEEDVDALYDGDGLSVFFLPRKGKDIRVSAAGSGERWNEILKWNGYKFSSYTVE